MIRSCSLKRTPSNNREDVAVAEEVEVDDEDEEVVVLIVAPIIVCTFFFKKFACSAVGVTVGSAAALGVGGWSCLNMSYPYAKRR